MPKIQAYVHRIHPLAPNPAYATESSAGFDLAALGSCRIAPGEVRAIRTGLVIKPPEGYHLKLYARSSLVVKKNLIVANGVGVVDADYCGASDEVKILVMNVGKDPVYIMSGDRIAQGVFEPLVQADFETFSPAPESRGGFGSTGGYQ